MYNENKDKIVELRARLVTLGDVFELDTKRTELAEIESMSGAEGFWDDAAEAQRVLKRGGLLKDVIDGWESIYNELEDTQILAELSEEEGDEVTAREAMEKMSELEDRVEDLEFKRILGGEDDHRNSIVSINAGAGGTEAQDWAEMLLRMYLRYGERHGYELTILAYQAGDEAGLKSTTFMVNGPYAYGYLKGESGVHRLVRISPFDANKRRHTSFCSVFVSPEVEDNIEVEIDDKDLRVDTYRASGAGGQHVNKTDSAVRITHMPTGIVVSCQNERSQHQNRYTAMKVLRARLYELEKEKQMAKLDKLSSAKKEIGWGSQIRSYVLHPYQMIKDHRTEFETGNVDAVLDGELDGFIKSYLLHTTEGSTH